MKIAVSKTENNTTFITVEKTSDDHYMVKKLGNFILSNRINDVKVEFPPNKDEPISIDIIFENLTGVKEKVIETIQRFTTAQKIILEDAVLIGL